MRRLLVSGCLLALAFICCPAHPAPQDADLVGFFPFGLYQPCCGTRGTSMHPHANTCCFFTTPVDVGYTVHEKY